MWKHHSRASNSVLNDFSMLSTSQVLWSKFRLTLGFISSGILFIITGTSIDGLHLTSRRPCCRYNTKEYVISPIVGSSRRGWLTLSAASREIDCKPRIGFRFYPNGLCKSPYVRAPLSN